MVLLPGAVPEGLGFLRVPVPGFLVHAAAILTLAVLGFWMLRGGPLLVPLLALYGVLGIYLGRDLARAKRLKAPRAFRGRLEQHGKPVPRS